MYLNRVSHFSPSKPHTETQSSSRTHNPPRRLEYNIFFFFTVSFNLIRILKIHESKSFISQTFNTLDKTVILPPIVVVLRPKLHRKSNATIRCFSAKPKLSVRCKPRLPSFVYPCSELPSYVKYETDNEDEGEGVSINPARHDLHPQWRSDPSENPNYTIG